MKDIKENERLNFKVQYKDSNDEQDEVRNYVLTKYLQRPKTNIFTLLVMHIVYGVICTIITFFCFLWLDVSKFFSALVSIAICLIILLLFARFCLIKIVECYQHYAKEETRRRCLCMPTCSEYAIAVLKKHCLWVALKKIRKRLFVTCRDGLYKKDMP